MKQQQFPDWFVNMMQTFLDMRDAQRSYFKNRSDHNLKVAKQKEQQADVYLERFKKTGKISHKSGAAKQSNLF